MKRTSTPAKDGPINPQVSQECRVAYECNQSDWKPDKEHMRKVYEAAKECVK